MTPTTATTGETYSPHTSEVISSLPHVEPAYFTFIVLFIALFTVLLLCVDYILQSRSSTPPNDSSAGPVGGPAPATCVTREATTLPSADPSKPDTTLRLFVVHPPFDGPPYWVVQRDTLDKPREFAGPQAKAHVMSYERYDNKDDAYQAYQEQVERHVAQ